MWMMWLREHGRWLAAGAGVMVAGFGLARFWWFEFGMALILLGAAALGYLVGLARSAVLDAELTERIDRQLDELREEQRRVQEEKWLSDGVSPIEKSWRALAQRAGAADEDPAAEAVPANDIDQRLADLIRQRCDRVWRGIKEKRYWRQVDGKTVGPDLGAIGGEIEGVVRRWRPGRSSGSGRPAAPVQGTQAPSARIDGLPGPDRAPRLDCRARSISRIRRGSGSAWFQQFSHEVHRPICPIMCSVKSIARCLAWAPVRDDLASVAPRHRVDAVDAALRPSRRDFEPNQGLGAPPRPQKGTTTGRSCSTMNSVSSGQPSPSCAAGLDPPPRSSRTRPAPREARGRVARRARARAADACRRGRRG